MTQQYGNKINIQMEDISVKMNAMTKPVLATEAGYVNHSLDILDQPDEN